MSPKIDGLAVSRGIAIGRAVLVHANRLSVAHYLIEADQVPSELERVRLARDAVVVELTQLHDQLEATTGQNAHQELAALLEVHLMLLQDEQLTLGVRERITQRFYNAEWALTAQLDEVSRQFDAMEDPYLRERKADLEQVVERLLAHMRGLEAVAAATPKRPPKDAQTGDDTKWVLVAHDLSPADMMHFRQHVFAGFVTDVGGKTSHTAIVARSLDIPAVVGARSASSQIATDDWVIIDGDSGVVFVNPSPIVLAEYTLKQRQGEAEKARLTQIKNTPAVTRDGERIELLANIEQPEDTTPAMAMGAVGVGLFRTEFLFMGRNGQLPDEDTQYDAYRRAVEGMYGMPVTIRTIDVGADKPLDRSSSLHDGQLNPALGLRAIRRSLAEPEMFLTQLRAVLRAAAHGKVNLLMPMVAHLSEVRQIVSFVKKAKTQLDATGHVYGPVRLGAMIEVPAAALAIRYFLKYFDYVSIGTNDLIQYTLAIDRVDESVSHLYDPLHPAVLQMIAQVIAACREMGKGVSVCGEMAGDPAMTRLLLGLGLRSFSMHPAQLLAVKHQILSADTRALQAWAQKVIDSEEPGLVMLQDS